jgi:hypothetical protein
VCEVAITFAIAHDRICAQPQANYLFQQRHESLTGNEDESIQWDTTISPQRANAR